MKINSRFLGIIVLALLFRHDALASGNGVSIVDPNDVPGHDSLAIWPAEPHAYEPFKLYFYADGLHSTHSIAIEVVNNEIWLLHRSPGPSHMGGNLVNLVTEIQGLPEGDYMIKSYFFSPELNGQYSIDDLGSPDVGRPASDMEFSIAPPPPTQQAYTFFHPGINHFFVSADDDERNLVVGNGGTYSWHMADFGFNVWHADDPAPSTALPVCRFYSALVNSHFYTASESECDELKANPGSTWIYEGIAFQALVPLDGACTSGTTPVWRLFNNRHEQLDSNHRYVASPETYRAMIADGWAGEGVAFCSPPRSP